MTTDNQDSTGSSLTRRSFAALPIGAALNPRASGAASERRWTVFVIQHSHIDIGYTEKQEIIAAQHGQFVGQALDFSLSEKQKDRTPECRFKFTLEGFWQVEQFLARAGREQRRRFISSLRQGVMELTASYVHMTELPGMDLLRRAISFGARFAREEGIPLITAMGCDINGLSWGMADAYAEAGVKYLSMNINHHHGGYPFGRPLVPFYWESPNGKRILTWSGFAYHRANVFGLMGGQAPEVDVAIPGFSLPGSNQWEDIKDISFAERRFLPLLEWLEKSGYPLDFFPVMGSGLYTDNSPPGEDYCDIIREWNQKHGDRVHVRTATLGEFFSHLEANAKDLPVHRGEWTDWWSDGVAATPVDTMLYRNAQRTRALIDALDPKRAVVPDERLCAIDRKLLLYAEHTFGYSHTSDTTLLAQQVFARKSKHAVEADEFASAALYQVLRARGEGEFASRRPLVYKVVNPLSARMRGAARLPLDPWDTPRIRSGARVVDVKGALYPHQMQQVPRGYVAVVALELAPGEERELTIDPSSQAAIAETPAAPGFENEFYRAMWDDQRGLFEITDRTTGERVLDAQESGGIGSPVYQVFPQGSRSQIGRASGVRVRPRDEISRGQCVTVRRVASGPVFERWEFQYQAPGTSRYVLSATFYHSLPQIELTVSLYKLDVRDPEGTYVFFPLAAEGGVWHFDKPGSPVRPGLDQLPKTCCDYYCIQHGAALVGRKGGVIYTTLDAPLVHLGKLRLWDYSTEIAPVGPIYSWLTNNKWETNFRISCAGAYEFRYVIQAGKEFADPKAAMAHCVTLSYFPLVLRG